MRSRSLTLVLTTLALACAYPAAGVGQDTADEAPVAQEEHTWHNFARQVLVENCDLELEVINMVAAAQFEQLASPAKDGRLDVKWTLKRPGSRISPQAEICTVIAEWEGPAGEVEYLKAWDVARKNAEAALRGVQQAAIDGRNDAIERQVEELKEQQRDYTHQLADVRQKLEAMSGAYSEQFTRVQFDAAASKLQELELERVGLAARREAIERRVDDLRDLDADSAQDDPVIAELRKLVDIREEQFANVKALHDAGQRAASSMDMRTAQAEVAHARIEMLRAEKAAAEAANGPLMRELNNELSRLIIRDAELKATRDALEQRTSALEDLIESADERALLSQQSDALRGVIGVIEGKIRELQDESNQPVGPITIKPLADALPKQQP